MSRFHYSIVMPVALICAPIVSPREALAKPASLLTPLLSAADAIVVGESLSFYWEEQHVDQTIRIIRVLKGNLAPNDRVQVSMQIRARIAKPLSAGAVGYYGVFFLTAAQGNARQLLKVPDGAPDYPYSYRVVQPDLPAQFSYSNSDSLGNRLASELAAAVYEADGRAYYASSVVYHLGIADERTQDRIYAIFAASPLPALQSIGLAGQIMNGSSNALAKVADNLSLFADTPGAIAISNAMYQFDGNDDTAARALGRIANAGPQTNWAPANGASQALMRVHTRAAIPYLAELLDSADLSLRPNAIRGIAAYALGCGPWRHDEGLNEACGPALKNAEQSLTALKPGQSPTPAQPDAEVLRHAHLDGLADQSTVEEHAQFWRAWWKARNQ
jgi:hypothetical protein